MKKRRTLLKFLLLSPLGRFIGSIITALGLGAYAGSKVYYKTYYYISREIEDKNKIILPLPKLIGTMSVEEALAFRRSIREYTDDPITLEKLSQILWAAYGISEIKWGLRTAPSAGACYPLEIYVIVSLNGVISDNGYIAPGIYHYNVQSHVLGLIKSGDFREELYKAALEQEWVRKAPVNIVITAIYERTTQRYGERGRIRYVHMDLGHVGQNIYLQATALSLGTVAIGAFHDDNVKKIIGLPDYEEPLYIMPLGVPSWKHRLSQEELKNFYDKYR
ncbi:MAG: SagB/ThcOx family dehydrogenase [Thermoprotei archaeon]